MNLSGYKELIDSVGLLLEKARKSVYFQVNIVLVKTYWDIGKIMVNYEQKNAEKGGYGTKVFENLAVGLREKYGKGFSRSNVIYMRLLYLKYPKSQTLSDQLSWSHYIELLMIEKDLERSFYEKGCIKEHWSVRELKRQKSSALFERLAFGKNKQEVLTLSKNGHLIEKAEDAIKDPYILEFLGLEETISEKDLEQRLIHNLQHFLLELGKGFTFVARQFRITLGNKHYYVDLVFYHRILRCFVLIDLKINSVTHADVGQMNMYLNYFKKEEMNSADNEPIGLILAKEKEKVVVEYALGGLSNKLFVSKYKLYLPDKKELEQQVQKVLKGGKE